MAGIVFYFEDSDIDVWSGRNIDLDIWNYAMSFCDCITDAIVINKTDENLTSFNEAYNIQYVSSMPSLTGHITQIVCPWEVTAEPQTNLWDFDHQTDWYVFGHAGGWDNYFGDSLVTIPQGSQAATHSIFVGTTVLYHRYWRLYGSTS